ncbi:MAG: disulfide bond formation protein B [Methylococcales bacterium]
MKYPPRIWFFFGFLLCLGMMLIAAWFQFVKGLEPCPLCIAQRIAVIAVGLVFLVAAFHNPQRPGIRIYALLGFIVAVIGAAISIRHVWLQNLPPEEVPACGPGIEYMFEYFPLADAIKMMLSGTGECAEVLWTFLGISIPGWTLVTFISLALYSLSQLWNFSTTNPREETV